MIEYIVQLIPLVVVGIGGYIAAEKAREPELAQVILALTMMPITLIAFVLFMEALAALAGG